MTLVIIADDLTGAADSAARCHHAGMAAHIYLQPPGLPLAAGAVALSSDSRFLPPAEAAQRVCDLLAPLRNSEAVWYKKIDSTLRGNIGAEIDAMLNLVTPAGEQPCAVVCPAFPVQGRGLEEGYLVYAQAPARTLHLPTILAGQTQRPLAAIALADVRGGSAHLAQTLVAARTQGAQILVVDALTDGDLETLVAATHQAAPAALLCGSAGLIEPLARGLVQPQGEPVRENTGADPMRLPILMVVGSGSAMAHRQIEALRSAPGVDIGELKPGRLTKFMAQREGVQRQGWVIHLPKPDAQTLLEGQGAREWVDQLAQVAVGLVKSLQPATFVLVGGDTAVHVLGRLGIQRLTVLAEVMPGIPLLAGIDETRTEYRIVTKAGNFGDELTLVNLLQGAKTLL